MICHEIARNALDRMQITRLPSSRGGGVIIECRILTNLETAYEPGAAELAAVPARDAVCSIGRPIIDQMAGVLREC